MVSTSTGGSAAKPARPVVSASVDERRSRDPEVALEDLAPRVGALRGVRPQQSDWLSRALRRDLYLPGV
jgi:hypothetical protein